MLTFEKYTEYIHELNQILSIFLSVEKELMNCGLSPLNFNESTEQIKLIEDAVIHLKEMFSEYVNQSEGNYSINTAITYVDHLLESIGQLKTISRNLALKANREGKYGFFAYKKDLKIYKNKEKIRESFGSQLNSALSRPW